jgi:hypothetical protein
MLVQVLAFSLFLKSDIHPDLKAIVSSREATSKLPALEQMSRNEKNNQAIFKLINDNALSEATEFRVAGENLQTYSNDYENVRVQYELFYAAVAMGDDDARKHLGWSWDQLMMSLGHKRPIAAFKSVPRESWKPLLAPKSIVSIWLQQSKDKVATDSAEVSKMFKDDQEIRQGEMTDADMKKMIEGDEARLKRIKQIVRENRLHTATDYYNAAFLFQHGENFEDYQMAHQLSVCSVLLGNKDARWIGAASYDRMLRSVGHKQRWATQYRSVDSVWFIQSYDSDGICDHQRQAITGKTLEQAVNFKGG